MGDNDYEGGFKAPGAYGTPHLIFPTDGADATLTAVAAGEDGVLGTDDDHRLVRGADGVAGTPDDLDQSNVDACCHVAHGNLQDGVALPPTATVLMTATFAGVSKPILAEYCLGYGRVIVDTVTKEFEAHQPAGTGPSLFMMSLLGYALDARAQTGCRISGLIEAVDRLDPRVQGGDEPLFRGVRPRACRGHQHGDESRHTGRDPTRKSPERQGGCQDAA